MQIPHDTWQARIAETKGIDDAALVGALAASVPDALWDDAVTVAKAVRKA